MSWTFVNDGLWKLWIQLDSSEEWLVCFSRQLTWLISKHRFSPHAVGTSPHLDSVLFTLARLRGACPVHAWLQLLQEIWGDFIKLQTAVWQMTIKKWGFIQGPSPKKWDLCQPCSGSSFCGFLSRAVIRRVAFYVTVHSCGLQEGSSNSCYADLPEIERSHYF